MSAPRAGAGYAARGGAGRHIRPHRAGLLQNAPDLAIGEPVPHGEHGHQRPFGKPFTGQFVTFKVDVPVPRVHESLTAGGDIQRRASVAPDQLGSLFAADDLHQFFTLFLPTQRDAERNGKTCPALGPDELDRRRKANQFNQFIHALPPCPGLPGKHLRRRAAPLPPCVPYESLLGKRCTSPPRVERHGKQCPERVLPEGLRRGGRPNC